MKIDFERNKGKKNLVLTGGQGMLEQDREKGWGYK